MSTLGTFDSFTTSRLGIYAAQQGLMVTGNNISNINTAGYTRQRLDQVSFKTGVNDRYASMLDNHVGRGALVTGINQIRDPFLDIRYRNTSTDTAYYDTKLNGLQNIASILDEVGKGENEDGLLYRELQDLAEKLRGFSSDPNSDNETLVRNSAEAITSLFNNYAGRLERLRVETEEDFDKNITAVNKILTNIQALNKSIRECEIHNDWALEMRDERNRQIDDLAQYLDIKVEYSYEDIGAGIQVEKLTIKLNNANPDPEVETDSAMLVDGLYVTQLSVPDDRPVMNPYIKPSAADLAANPDLDNLKGFLFLKEVPAGTADSVEIDWTDADGNLTKINVVGTNDPADEGIVLEENDNYTIQLGKLLDTHGEEWKKDTTTWEEMTGQGVVGQRAVYKTTLQLNGDIPDAIYFDGTNNPETTVPDSVTTVEDLARFVAAQLNARNQDYTITSNGADLVYTAVKAGAVGGGQGPAAAPTLSITGKNVTVTALPPALDTPGVDSVAPTLPAGETPYSVDAFGTETWNYFREVDGKWFKITLVTEHTREVALDDNDLNGELQAQREFLTEEGEFSSDKDIFIDEQALTKRGIKYYQQAFDLLAQTFAEQYNKLNQGYAVDQEGYYINKQGKRIEMGTVDGTNLGPVSKYDGLTKDQSDVLIASGFILKNQNGTDVLDKDGKQVADVDAWLAKMAELMPENEGPWFEGGVLFSNRGDGDNTEGITAANISISYSWGHKEINLVPKFEHLFRDGEEEMNHSTKNINADHMVALIDQALTYNPADLYGSDAVGPKLFPACSFNDMLSNMMATEANDARVTNVKLNNSYLTLVDLDSQREGVSGVDLNDEAMNMMQYQKAMNAAMRLMTTIDEALDRLINNTGVAGR